MKIPCYNFESSPDGLRFEFDSISDRKKIRKVVEFTPLPQNPEIFNLGFGDMKTDGTIDDLIVSNNQDMEKVLATIIQIIFEFFKTRTGKIILILRSTASRSRLYQIVIAKNITEMNDILLVKGIRNGEVEDFVSEVNYEGFFIKMK
ncbi:MAG: hypothetical protein LCH67_20010 [Bacteroidetes bacterium]|nr:hypothetical protein [Bacteroidota bacterium]